MNFKNILPVLFAALFFGACKKIDIEPDFVDVPVFSINLKIDGEDKNFIAGENDYYQFTGKTEENGIFEFYGDLRQENCTDDCEPSLKITFRGNAPNATDLFSSSSSNFKYKEINPSGTARARVYLDAVPFGEPPYEHLWEFEDMPDQTGDHVIAEFDDLGIQKIKLTTTDAIGCANVSEQEIDLSGVAPGFSGCEDFIFFVQPLDSTNLDPNFFVFLISPSGNTPDSIIWNDGTVDFVNCFHLDSVQGKICATVFEQNCEEEFCLSLSGVSSVSTPEFCGTQFTVREEFVFVPSDSLQLGTVTVEYTDETGEIFTSEITHQEPSAFFNILNFEPFDLNEKGEPTVRIESEFACKLASFSGEVLTIEAASGTFGVVN